VVLVDVGSLAVAVKDHDDFGGGSDRDAGVRCHGCKLGSLTGFHDEFSVAKKQTNPAFDDEHPIVAWVHLLLGWRRCGFEAHFDGDCLSGGSAQHPRCDAVSTAWYWPYYDIFITMNVKENIEINVERSG
jgi:hypothetical protein